MIIPIFHCFDHNYVIPAAVCFQTLLEHAKRPDTRYDIYVVGSDLTDEDKSLLTRIVQKFPQGTLTFLDPAPARDFINELKASGHWCAEYTADLFYKLSVPELLPNEDIVVLADVDVVYEDDIARSFDELKVTDDIYVAGGRDPAYSAWRGEGLFPNRPKMQRKYFKLYTQEERDRQFLAAGLLVFNCRKLREDGIVKKWREWALKNVHRLILPEQDIINQVCAPKLKALPWNHMAIAPNFAKVPGSCWDEMYTNVVQMHYASYKKPWKFADCAMSELWYAAADRAGVDFVRPRPAPKRRSSIHRQLLMLHDECNKKLGIERYRTFVRVNGGTPEALKTPMRFVADPFLFAHDNKAYLFYETVDAHEKGRLGVFERQANGEWRDLGTVLEEHYHLSYPQVIEFGGKVYMIPESCDSHNNLKDGGLFLYEAVDFPTKWRKVQTLVNRPLVDTTIWETGGTWYLSGMVAREDKAEVWTAPSLLGPWTIHPQSRNHNQSRRLVRNGGRVYDNCRLAQDCNGAYGKRIFKVPFKKLSPTEYVEDKAQYYPLAETWGVKGHIHTYNRIELNGEKIECIDVHDYPRKPLFAYLGALIGLFSHLLFKFQFKKKSYLIQIFGIQFAHGDYKPRPAFKQYEI